MKVIDTYWSITVDIPLFANIKSAEIEDGYFTEPIKEVYKDYLKSRILYMVIKKGYFFDGHGYNCHERIEKREAC